MPHLSICSSKGQISHEQCREKKQNVMYHQEFAICIGAIHVALAYSTPASPLVSRPQTQMSLCLVSCRCFLGHPREVCFTQEGGQDSVILSPGRYAIYGDQLQYLIHMLFLGKPTSHGQVRPRYSMFYLCRASGYCILLQGYLVSVGDTSPIGWVCPVIVFLFPLLHPTFTTPPSQNIFYRRTGWKLVIGGS